jgi:hypothetical protein
VRGQVGEPEDKGGKTIAVGAMATGRVENVLWTGPDDSTFLPFPETETGAAISVTGTPPNDTIDNGIESRVFAPSGVAANRGRDNVVQIRHFGGGGEPDRPMYSLTRANE